MDKAIKKAIALKRKFLREANVNWPLTLVEVDRELWPALVSKDRVPVRVLRSRDFLMQVYDERDFFIILSVCRTDLQSDGQWRQDITWEELQDLKKQAGYGERCAVEVYPNDSDVVNVANLRHLFVLPKGTHLGWRPSLAKKETHDAPQHD
jgi:hypothetical protein